MITAVVAITHSTPQRADLVRFYREGLGLGDPAHHRGEESFQVGELRLAINSGEAGIRAPTPRLAITLQVDDLEGHVSQLKQMGVPFDLEPTADAGGRRRAICRDPDGNLVTLLAAPRSGPRKDPPDLDGRPSPVTAPREGSEKAAKKR